MSEDAPAAPQQQHQAESRRVLIAIDRSGHSERALRWFAEKIYRPGDSVTLVNVTEPPEMALGFGMAGLAVAEAYATAVDMAVDAAKQLAETSRQICGELGVHGVRFLERVGHRPGAVIVAAADEAAADVIVLGSRGAGLIRRTFLGSVSDYVVHHSHRAVLLVPPPPPPQPPQPQPDQPKPQEAESEN